MKRNKYLWCMAVALFSLIAWAAEVTGSWAGEFHTNEGGTFPVTLTLKADGSTLSGTFQQGSGEPLQINDGKVDGNIISFSITRSFQEQTQKIGFTGTIDGNQMKLMRQIPGGQRSLEMTLTKK